MKPDIADIIAGELVISRATAYDLMRKALKDTEQPAQEPAEWQKRHPQRTQGKWITTDEHDAKWWRDNSPGWDARALYTAPPKRPWVDLTDEGIFSVLGNLQAMYNRPPTEDSRVVFARAILAKSKELNK